MRLRHPIGRRPVSPSSARYDSDAVLACFVGRARARGARRSFASMSVRIPVLAHTRMQHSYASADTSAPCPCAPRPWASPAAVSPLPRRRPRRLHSCPASRARRTGSRAVSSAPRSAPCPGSARGRACTEARPRPVLLFVRLVTQLLRVGPTEPVQHPGFGYAFLWLLRVRASAPPETSAETAQLCGGTLLAARAHAAERALRLQLSGAASALLCRAVVTRMRI